MIYQSPRRPSFHISPTVLQDPENVGVAVGIPLPATIQDLQSELYRPYKCFQRHIRHFDFRYGWILVWHDIVSSSGDFDVLQKLVKQRCTRSHGEIHFLIQGLPIYHFRLKNSSTHLRFQCRHSMTGWATSGISSHFIRIEWL